MAIRDFVPFENIEGNFIIKFKKPVQKYARGYGFQLNVSDSTGSIMLKYWGPDNEERVKALFDSLQKGDVIFVRGKVDVYNEQASINVDSSGVIKKLEKGEYDESEFVRKSERSPDEIERELMEYLSSVTDSGIKAVIDAFLSDEEFMEKFKKHPAAMYRHHGWIYGLMEHTVNMMRLCSAMAESYPDLDRDLMIAGCFIHDIGKLDELEISGTIRPTEEGMLVGHVTQGAIMLERKMNEAKTEKKLRMKLMNMLVSHHGQLEFGSPKLPGFPEALAVAYADMADARVSEMLDLKKNAQTDDKFAYSRALGNIYLD